MALLLGLDLGTSYFKAGLFDASGALRGLGRVAVDRDQPGPGRSELPVARFWATLKAAVADALAEAKADAGQIAALAYSSQASTFLLLDGDDRPLTPLIVWNDTRGEPAVPELARLAATEGFRRAIGWDALSGMNALCKWRTLQQAAPEIWRRARRIMTLPDYLTFALTGERVADGGTAAFLGVFDLTRGAWWAPALDAAEIPAEMLSQPLRPGTACGRTTPAAAALLGIPPGLPYAVGSLDHHVAALGAGLGTFADVSISTGTVLAALALTNEVVPAAGRYHGQHFAAAAPGAAPLRDRLGASRINLDSGASPASHVPGKLGAGASPPSYYRLTYDPAGAGRLEDYQRTGAPQCTLPDLLDQAGRARQGDRSTDHGAGVLAILEAVARTQRELARAAAGAAIRSVVATGGGARSPLWLQIQADMFGVPVATVASPEPGCLGAAVLAAAAAGLHGSIANASDAMVRPGRVYSPLPAYAARYAD